MRVNDIMSAPVYTIGANESAATAWETMRFRQTRHLVVTGEEGRVIGVLSASDLGGKNGDAVRARRRVCDLMTEKLVVAHPETTIREAANLMRGHAVNCLPVFNARDRLKGIVTVVDLLELIGRGEQRPMEAAPRAVLKSRGLKPRQAQAHSQRAAR
jgi:IMP dehydrogenase